MKISNVNGLDSSKYYVVVTHNNNVCLLESSSATLSVNLLPTAVADNYTTNEDTSTTLTPLTTGTSDNDPEGSVLTITSINGVTLTGVAQTIPVTNGNVIIDAVGTITFTPSNNYYGTVSFPYTISDDNNGTDSALITIVVDAVNDLPNAVNDTATVDENSTNNNIDVLDNDDFGGDGPNTGAITLSSGTTNNNGTVTVNNNDTPNDPTDDTLTYTPASNFSGTDTFEYTITDSNGDTKKQLLARSRYIIAKKSKDWTDNQKQRSVLLFKLYPSIEKAYKHTLAFRNIYEQKSKQEAKIKFKEWIEKTKELGLKNFNTAANSIMFHFDTILNFFDNRNTNANAESFNSKIKLLELIKEA